MVTRNESGFPDYPTCLRARLPGGRLVGTDGSMWLYRAVPLNPVLDASSAAEGLAAGDPLFSAFEELASITSVGMARRSTAKGGYRQVHLLLINVPMAYRPPAGHPLAEYLAASYANESMDRRVLLFGVQLQPKVTSRGLRAAVQSVADTILVGGAPIEDFDADAATVSAALGRAGLSDAPDDALRLANAWWTHGDRPDVPMLEHADHLHLFLNGADAARAAEAGVGCNDDAWKPLSQHAVTFVSVQDFETDMVPADSPAAWWAARLLAQGALAISIRGGVEPSKVTRAELRRRKRQFMEDINEAAQNGKMERAEQTEALELLSATEAAFSGGGAPSVLTDASVVAALSGRIGDISQVSAECGLKLNTMDYRQLAAMSELWPCSNIRANPHLHDIPVQSIAYSGLPSISRVGDADGAQLGFTEGDRQIALVSPTAAADQDHVPIMVVVGQSGSGKATTLETVVPTPTGSTTMGDLSVSDEVIGRDGTTCRVTAVFDHDELEMYDVVFSDGQAVRCCGDHLWVVDRFADRRYVTGPKRRASAERWDRLQDAIADLERLAQMATGLSTRSEIIRLIESVSTTRAVGLLGRATLVRVLADAEVAEVRLRGMGKEKRSSTREALSAVVDHLRSAAGSRPSTEPQLEVWSTSDILGRGLMDRNTYRFSVPLPSPVESPEVDLPIDPYVYGVWLGDGTLRDGYISAGNEDAAEMVLLLSQQWKSVSDAMVRPDLHRISLDRPHLDLCPYGHPKVDGRRNCGICQREVHTLPKAERPDRWNVSLRSALAHNGLIESKRIPMSYLRSSVEQRLALLQGLMDTDGHCTDAGDCQLRLHDLDLITDAVELIRSLGIKTHLRSYPKAGRSTSYVATFSTNLPVFRLQRKARRQKASYAPKTGRLAIVSITPAGRHPGRCITVDSSDHTFLVAGFIPTHNTQTMLWLADQYARMGHNSIILDPKTGSDHDAAVLNAGGQVASLDSLMGADGVFDPMRFAAKSEVGVELAASVLMQVNPWGHAREDFETPLVRSLAYGAEHGATCIGQALQIALDAGVAPPDMVHRVFDLAESSPMFRACMGITPGTTSLRSAEGLTLIKVGDSYLDLPGPGSPPDSQNQRVALAVIRMMVFGSAMALAGRERGGVLLADEAWTILGSGRSEVERLGRLARSQGVLPMLFTQRVTDALNAGLRGYISRGLILPISDPDEAVAACDLFELEATPERISRITAKATIGGTDGTPGAPNWHSMRALRDQRTGRVLRGAVGIYADLHGRAVPVEVAIPREFLERASTNPDDIRRRQGRLALTAEAGPDATPADGFDTALGLG